MEALMPMSAGTVPARRRRRRPPISRLPLPSTTRRHELFNCVSHAAGVGLGAFALGWMLACAKGSLMPNVMAGIMIYGISLIALYAVSATYHGLPEGLAKRVMRVADHCTIYLLIAGCYTPVALIAFWGTPYCAALLLLEWGIAAVGIALNAWDMTSRSVKTFSIISYVVMGWAVVLVPVDVLIDVGSVWLPWIAAGGISYTAGIAFFGLGSKRPSMHCVWHLFVLLGSALQLVGFIQMV